MNFFGDQNLGRDVDDILKCYLDATELRNIPIQQAAAVFLILFLGLFYCWQMLLVDCSANTDKYVNYELVLVEGRMVREGK